MRPATPRPTPDDVYGVGTVCRIKQMMKQPGVTYDGVSGHIAFDETGDAIRDTAYIKTIDSAANAWKFVTQQKAS